MIRQPEARDLVALQEFRWPVDVDGYEWVESTGPGGGPGVALKPGGKAVDRVVGPVHPGLFVDFAQLPATRDGILRFAFDNGLLGICQKPAEPRAEWRRHIGRMRRAFKLMQSARRGDREQAAEIANEEISAYVEPKLALDTNSDLFRPRWQPKHLLGAMWVQLACTFDTAARFPSCAVCERTMLVASWLPGGRRGQAKYCSNKCTQKAKRVKAKARLMLAEGASRRKVVTELKVTEAWLRGMKL